MKIKFLTHGGPQIGMGHIMRCLTLAREFKATRPDVQCSFVVNENDESQNLIRQAFPEDTKIISKHGDIFPSDVLIVDKLQVEIDTMKLLKTKTGKLVSIDDIGPGHFEADLSFNFLYACKAPRPAHSTTKSYFGFQYVILDQAFDHGAYETAQTARNILLIQGGADPHGLLPEITFGLRPWLTQNLSVTLHLHLGLSAKTQAYLNRLEQASAGLNVVKHTKLKDMRAYFSKADIAISAGGMSACELVALGVPTLLVTGELKELETMKNLNDVGAALTLGSYTPLTASALAENLTRLSADVELRRKLSNGGRRIVDGQGTKRIVDLIYGSI